MKKYKIEFSNSAHNSVEMDENSELSEQLSVQNSPILFGCRTGICGTCLVQVEEGAQALAPAGDEELEVIDIFSNGEPNLRLACRIKLTNHLKIKYIGK